MTPKTLQMSFGVGGPTKQIVESIVTSGFPPEEILQQLDSYGIDWYVTERGDLMIRYWQVGAEDFVPIERVATIRESRPVPSDAEALEWLSTHLRDIRARYGGQWIAIVGNTIVSAAPNLPSLLRELHQAGVERPLITEVPAERVIWTTAYAY